MGSTFSVNEADVAWYAPFLVIGVVTVLTMAGVAFAPAALQALTRVAGGLLGGVARPHFWDSVAFLIFGFAPITTALAVHARDWLRRRRPRSAGSVVDTPATERLEAHS